MFKTKQILTILALALGASPLHAQEGTKGGQHGCHKQCACAEHSSKDKLVCGTLFTAEITPTYSDECGQCYPDPRPGAVTCFTGSAAIAPKPENKLLTNNIDPVMYNDCGKCVADPTGTTTFSGNVLVEQDFEVAEGCSSTFQSSATFNDNSTFNAPVVFNDDVTFVNGVPLGDRVTIGRTRIIGQKSVGVISGATTVLTVTGSPVYVKIVITGTWSGGDPIAFAGEYIIANGDTTEISNYIVGSGSRNFLALANNGTTIQLKTGPFSAGSFNGGQLFYEVIGGNVANAS